MYMNIILTPVIIEDIAQKRVPLFTDCTCTLLSLSLPVAVITLLDLTSLICSRLFERLSSNGFYTIKIFIYQLLLAVIIYVNLTCTIIQQKGT